MPEIIGTNFDETIVGTDGDDDIVALNGDDVIFGGFGDDHIFGGSGNDYIESNIGDDMLHGGAGDDILISSETLGNGDNFFTFNPNAPFDVLEGGSGADTFSVSNGGQAIVTDFSLADGDRIELSALDNIQIIPNESLGALVFSGDTTTMIVAANPVDFDAIADSALYF